MNDQPRLIKEEEKKETKQLTEEKESEKRKTKKRHKGECSKCGKIHFNCFCCEDPASCPIHGHL